MAIANRGLLTSVRGNDHVSLWKFCKSPPDVFVDCCIPLDMFKKIAFSDLYINGKVVPLDGDHTRCEVYQREGR
jgi:hypothetical protein